MSYQTLKRGLEFLSVLLPPSRCCVEIERCPVSVLGRLFAGVSLIAAFIGAPAFAATRDVARRTLASTVLVVSYDKNHNTVALGSGFVSAPGFVVTNHHVIAGSVAATVKLVGSATAPVQARVVWVDSELDLAVLQTPSIRGTPLPTASFASLAIGDELFAAGNPRGLEGTFSQGIVSAFRDFGGHRLLQISAAISPGSSGGPVVNARGEVVGVAVATYKEGQSINFAVPASSVPLAFRTRSGSSPRRGQPTTSETASPVPNTENLSPPSLQAANLWPVKAEKFRWKVEKSINTDGCSVYARYNFGLRNYSDYTILKAEILVVFLDAEGTPVHSEYVQYPRFDSGIGEGTAIRPSMAKIDITEDRTTVPCVVHEQTSRVDLRVLRVETGNPSKRKAF